jgi:hypothetical protein
MNKLRLIFLMLLIIGGNLGCSGNNPEVQPTVMISGTAFEFVDMSIAIEGARVYIAEYPEIYTETDQSGYYQLEVPDNESVTPVIEAPDSPRMFLQTFHTSGQDLEDVKFQVINSVIYDIFAGVLGVQPDPDMCQISTTVNVAAVFGLELDEFKSYGAHGIAGVTVSVEPSIAIEQGPVYFSESTIPDRDLQATTIDGGVVWYNVPPGVYTFSAIHSEIEIMPFTATCEPDRFINAGPPWGLHERH